eukprot:1646298-Pyramimonas_sp.AAC.1
MKSVAILGRAPHWVASRSSGSRPFKRERRNLPCTLPMVLLSSMPRSDFCCSMAPWPLWKHVEHPPLAAIVSALSKWILTRTGWSRRATPSGLALDRSS